MAGHKDSFAAKIRTAVKKLRHDTMTYADISSTADLRSTLEEKKMRSTVKDFLKRGEMARIAPGVFRYVGQKKDNKITEKRRVMWNLLKMMRTVTVEDLQELAEVTYDYALEWLRMLVRREIVRKIEPEKPSLPCKWQLIKELAEMPEDEAQKEKYREIRRQKKDAAMSKALNTIQKGMALARKAEAMEE